MTFTIVSDTGVYTEGGMHGYERTALINGWNPDDPRALARVSILVHQYPSMSYCRIGVWDRTLHQYNLSAALPPNQYWHNCPGYLRGHQPGADRATMNLISEMVDRLVELVERAEYDFLV